MPLSRIGTNSITDYAVGATDLANNSIETYASNSGVSLTSKNRIINGAMEIAQRGNTFTNQATTSSPNGPYTLDRWKNNRASDVSGLTVTQSTDAPAGFINSMKLQRVAGNTGTEGTFLFHTLAREDSIPLAGKTVTLSFYAKAGANYSRAGNTISLSATTTTTDSDTKVYLFSPSVQVKSQSFTLTTSWQRFTTTFTLGSTIKQFGFNIQSSTLSGTAGADDSWYITGVQLEEGSVATPFERRPFGQELALCQRYFEKSWHPITPVATANYIGVTTSIIPGFTGQYTGTGYMAVTKRIVEPTMTFYNPQTGASGTARGSNGSNYNITVYWYPSGISFGYNISSFPAGANFTFHWTSNAEL